MKPVGIDEITFRGVPLVDSPDGFGYLRESSDVADDAEALRSRMKEDGYLYLRGLLDPERVLRARLSIAEKLAAEGLLDPASPVKDCVPRPGIELVFKANLALNNPAVEALLYEGEMMEFWARFFGGPVLHFDYTWLRARVPGIDSVTEPHCDTVYMNRGTPNLYTAWTPLGEVPLNFGGLLVLEGSHRRDDVLAEYWSMDVDTFCSNGPEASALLEGKKLWQSDKQNGAFDEDARAAQSKVGGRWLGAHYQIGDVLVFGMHTLHTASDNRTDRIRLSTDSRYQPAGEPADERWIGPNPVGHGVGSKKGMIC